MRETTDNTNELDSYGVWVKRPPQDENEAENILNDDAFSLPSFDGSQIVDENAIIPDSKKESDDTIPEGLDIPEGFDIPEDFSVPSIETAGMAEEAVSDETADSSETEEIDIDSFTDSEDAGSGEMEEIDLDAFGDFDSDAPSSSEGESEVSLDDFLGGDSGSSEEISLDDFLDGDSFESGPKPQKEDDVSNDEALDINLNFNESEEDSVPTIEITEESEYEDSQFEEEEAEAPLEEQKVQISQNIGPMEEVSLDDFSLDESDAATADAAAAAVQAQAGSEEVSLDEFGIDSEAGETPVTDNVRKAKKTVVDYDLAITEDDEITSAPSIKEIKADPKQEDKETPTENTAVNNELLEQIIHDLSGLKNEISALKNDLAVLKDKSSFEKAPGFPGAEENSADVLERAEEELGGFFGTSDEDDTIALSGDELTNIMNTADFTEEVAGETLSEDSPFAEETPAEEASVEEPSFEEAAMDSPAFEESPLEENNLEEPVFETKEAPAFEEPAAETTEETALEEPEVQEEASDFDGAALGLAAAGLGAAAIAGAAALNNSENDETIEENIPADSEIDTFDENVLDEEAFRAQEEANDESTESDSFDDIADGLVTDDIFEETAESFEAPSAEEENAFASDVQDSEIIDEPVLEEEGSVVPVEPEESVFEQPAFEETPIEEDVVSEEAIPAEPEFGEAAEDLPEEIDIPKVDDIADDIADETVTENDDIFVESSNSDFMNSVTAEEDSIQDGELENADEEMFDIQIEEPEPEEPVLSEENVMDDLLGTDDSVEENLTDENVDYLKEEEISSIDDAPLAEEVLPAEEAEPLTEEALPADDISPEETGLEEEAVPVEEPVFGDDALSIDETVAIDEPVEEPAAFEEPAEEMAEETAAFDEAPVFDVVTDESAGVAAVFDEPVSEPEEETTSFEEPVSEPAVAPAAPQDDSTLPGDLKNDVKSVLLYMDQLLENLPEDKIMEFAKSEQFATYKKLFAELGLS